MKNFDGRATRECIEGSTLVIEASEWINSSAVKFDDPHVRLNCVVAFQMLCPACVLHSIPQVQKARQLFSARGVQFIGLQSVFEHHAAMSNDHLRVFLHEFRVDFPIAVDARSNDSRIPVTMGRYRFCGTPTTLIVSQAGEILQHNFGVQGDMEFAINIQKYLN